MLSNKPRTLAEIRRDEAWQKTLGRFSDWCHCAGRGYWYEQVDGPTNRRLIKCEKHWKPEMQEEAKRGR
jgi:hypothetical protein